MAIDIMQPIRLSIDLGSGLVQTPLRMQLMKGDKKANRVIVALTDVGKEVDLTGVTVSGSFIRPDDAAEIPLVGTAEGNRAIVVLDDACYAQEGYCEINVALTMGGTKRTIVALTGNVLSKGSGAYVDVSDVIPSIDDIIAQYAEMKRVTEDVQAAAGSASTAAGNANTAAGKANAAAAKIDNMTVNAVSGTSAGAAISEKNGAMHIDFTLPKGEKGDKGDKGDPGDGNGTVTAVTVSGTKYEPDGTGNVDLGELGGGAEVDETLTQSGKAADAKATGDALNQLSQQKANQSGWTAGKNVVTGADGKLTTEDKPTIPSALPNPHALTINGQTYDGSESVNLTVGGSSDMLDKFVPGCVYHFAIDVNPPLDYGGTWEQIKDRFLVGAGDDFTLHETGGNRTDSNSLLYNLGVVGSGMGAYTGGTNQSLAGRVIGVTQDYANTATTMNRLSNTNLSILPPWRAVNMWKFVSHDEVV